jgi:hypothetical protein
MKLHTFFFALLTVPLIAAAQSNDSYECTMGDLVRRVSVDREGSAPVPCEVAYYKATEAPGERQVLWSAANDAGYCDARAAELVSRLEGWGWQCAEANAESEAVEAEDDIDEDDID